MHTFYVNSHDPLSCFFFTAKTTMTRCWAVGKRTNWTNISDNVYLLVSCGLGVINAEIASLVIIKSLVAKDD